MNKNQNKMKVSSRCLALFAFQGPGMEEERQNEPTMKIE